ncbi:MAG: carboxypeptidase-like regulatory domain-containing protein [Terracidiphilus sp.]|jgi:hypothetical protein
MRQARYRFFLLPLFLVLACAGAFAQANSEVTGIVTDQTGAVVGGANISLSDPATGFVRETVSGPTGLYDFSGLNPANYNLKVTAKGFESFVQTGIVVNTSLTFRVDVKLTLGKETETISVVADALAVQTDSNVVSTLINSEEITSIATENRNFVSLAALGLGVSSGLPDANTPGAVGSNFTISINGLRQSHNIWLIDGGESDDRGGAGGMQIQPSQDAIAEFSMLTSNYPPDYGISSGATISLSLKSGASKFHGSAWEENRNTDYDANEYENKTTTPATVRPTVKYNIYGFNVGGPVYIPHVYNSAKQKTFFFYNEEWRKTTGLATSNNATIDPKDVPSSANITTVDGVTGLQYVLPTYASAAGITGLVVPNVAWPGAKTPGDSTYYENVLKPAGLTPGLAFPNNVIPQSLFDANAVTYLTSGVLPAANVGATDYNVASVSLPLKIRDDIVRIDHNFNDKWSILGHYIGDTENEQEGGPELGWCTCKYNTLTSILASPSHSAAIKLSGAITPNLLVEASINYDGNQIDIVPSANTFLPSSWTVSPIVPAYQITRKIWPGMYWASSLPAGNGGGIGEDTATEPYHNAAQDYEPKLDVSYTLAKHSFKFGVSYNRYTKNQMIYGDEQGSYNWGQLTNDTLMDTLLGLSSGYSQDLLAPIRHYVNQTPSVYALDNWHVTPRLTLQLGLRYDALPHSWERQNYLGNFGQAAYLTGAANAPIWDAGGTIDAASPHLYEFAGIDSYINGTGLAGQNNFPIGVVTNDYKTLQPRVGFSEDLLGNGKTVIRGGFGTFYERMQGNDIFGVATSAPFNPSASVGNNEFSKPGTNWATGSVIAPTQLIFAGGTDSIAQTYRAPAVAMFSLGVQREVMPSLVWVVQYVGNIAWHQNVIDNAVNSLSPNIGVVNVGAPGTPTYLDARQVAGDGNGKYGTDAASSFNNYGGMNAWRQYPGYAGIGQDQNNTNGNYNGFQTGLRIQNRWGLSGEVDYTYSHELDITSYDRTNIDNPWNPKFDKGSGALDRRNLFNANYIYNLPIFNKSQGLLHSIAGGWQIAGTVVDQSGVPIPIGLSSSYDPVGLGGGYANRPNVTNPGVKLHYNKSVSNWFDVSRINNSITPSWAGGNNLGFGDMGKDFLVGPGRVNFTTSLYKSFAIYEQARFELRFESFNTFNHSEFNSVNTGSGALNGTYDPRNLELGGKFVF